MGGKFFLLLFLGLSFVFTPLFSLKGQQRLIKGVIYSTSDNSPLIGVNVSTKGESTLSNNNGEYILQIDSGTHFLQFALIGYLLQDVAIGNQSILNVYLEPRPLTLKIDISQIDSTDQQVVAIGYGTGARSQIMTSISSVSAKEIEQQPVSSLNQAIQARLAGVQVIQNSGTPAGGLALRIRGITSISSSNEPLYVIDGVPLNNYSNFSNANLRLGAQQGTNYFAGINPSDIASIDVLKDAAAASIYGSRAAAGVVMITTKRGKNQKTLVNFNTYFGIQEVTKRLDLLNSSEYIDLVQETFANAKLPLPNAVYADKSVDTDWQSLLFRKAPIQKYDISLQGGTDKSHFFVSGGYFSQKGVVVGSGFERYSFRLNFDQKISSVFRVGTSLTFSQDYHQHLQEDFIGNSVIVFLPLTRPNMTPFLPTGEYQIDLINNRDNPLATAETVQDNTTIRRFIGNAFAEYDLGNYLSLRSSLSIDWIGNKENFFRPPSTTIQGISLNGLGLAYQMQDFLWVSENTANYKRTFYNASSNQKHDLNLLFGLSAQRSMIDKIATSASGFSSDKVPSLVNGGTKRDASTSQEFWGMISYFSRFNYTFNEKYFVSVNFRIDGSSRFAANKKYAVFPSASIGWLLSEEKFIKKYDWINQLKIRTSWGLTGNQEIGNYTSQGLYVGGQGYMGLAGFVPSNISNPNLTWETTEQYNTGLDLSFFNNRISLLMDYYNKNTTGLLVNLPLPTTTGFASSLQNAGVMENKGFEFDLLTKNFIGKFSWTTRFNIAFNQNKVSSFPTTILTGVGGFSNITKEGLPISSFWGWQRVNKNVDPDTGDFVFEDLNKNGQTFNDVADMQVIGTALPKYTGGIYNSFSFADFDLSVYAQFVYGNDIFDFLRSRYEGMQGTNNGTKILLNRWKNVGDITDVPRPIANNFSNGRVSDVWLQSGSFLRLQTVSLGYNMPMNVCKKMRINNIRIYTTIQNLYTFTNYTGYDPEVNAYSQSNTAMGVDYGNYPRAKSYIFGINVGL